MRSRLPYMAVPTVREKRACGRSKMNLSGLIVHGLSAMSGYSDYFRPAAARYRRGRNIDCFWHRYGRDDPSSNRACGSRLDDPRARGSFDHPFTSLCRRDRGKLNAVGGTEQPPHRAGFRLRCLYSRAGKLGAQAEPSCDRPCPARGMNDHYIGAELEIFAAASNWKSYIAQKDRPVYPWQSARGGGRDRRQHAGVIQRSRLRMDLPRTRS